MVFQLTKRLAFPDPHWGDPDGLLAIGGDLSVDRLILAYSNGIFPWYAFREKVIQWWCPLQRFVIFPEEIHISHSMHTLMNKNKYKVTFNHAFEQVIRNCSKLRIEQEGAWLGEEMIEAYIRMYEQNLAASVTATFTSDGYLLKMDEIITGDIGIEQEGVMSWFSLNMHSTITIDKPGQPVTVPRPDWVPADADNT